MENMRKFLISTGVYIIGFLMVMLLVHYSFPILIFFGLVASVQLTHILISQDKSITDDSLLIYRTITDNILLTASLLIHGLWSSAIMATFSVYLICFFESYIFSITGKSKGWFIFIGSTVLVASLIGILRDPSNLILLSSSAVFVIIFINFTHAWVIKQRLIDQQQRDMELAKMEQARSLYSLVHHELQNINTILLAKAEMGICDASTVTKLLDRIQNTIISASFDIDCSDIIIYKVLNQFKCPELLTIDLDVYHTVIKMRYAPLMLAFSVFIQNAKEAGARKLAFSRSGNHLIIRDNGSGFDVSKLRLGYTTKTHGHGVGLVTAIETLEKNGIPTTVESTIGAGTTITMNLTNVLVNKGI